MKVNEFDLPNWDPFEAHFKGAIVRTARHGFYKVVESIGVFKKTFVPHPIYGRTMDAVIVNLIIPVGALIHVPPRFAGDPPKGFVQRKFRASEAFVHSQYVIDHYNHKDSKPVTRSVSGWDETFEYKTGATVRPKEPFDMQRGTCESGIHFFVNLKKALAY